MPETPSLEDLTAKYVVIANLISGVSSPPRWLVEQVERWAPCMMISRSILDRQPTRAELVEQIKEVVSALETIRKAIEDDAVREFLELPPLEPLYEAAYQQFIIDFSLRANAVLDHPDVVNPDGRAKPGRSKAMPAGVTSAKDDCATFVLEAGTLCRQEVPSSRDKTIAEAAQLFWEAAGGGSEGWGSSRAAGWRAHLDMAKSPAMESFREEIRRHLELAIAKNTELSIGVKPP